MIQKILTVPHPLLRQKSKPVVKIDKKIIKLIKDLKETLAVQKTPKGVGLSAPQIGVPKRIFVLKLDQKMATFINPKITFSSKKTLVETLPKEKRFMEGCLSVPGFWGFVNRPLKIKVSFQDLSGTKQEKKFEGRQASFFQHEYDHLEGILFIDRVLQQQGKLYKLEKDKEGKEVLEEVKLD